MPVSVENKTDFPIRNSSCVLHCHICKKIVKRRAVIFFFENQIHSTAHKTLSLIDLELFLCKCRYNVFKLLWTGNHKIKSHLCYNMLPI